MSIDYNKLRSDIETWAARLFSELDGVPVEPSLKAARITKPRTPKQPPITSVDNPTGEAAPAKPRRAKPNSQ